MKPISRRQFFKHLLSFTAVVFVAPRILAEEKRRAKPGAGTAPSGGSLPLAEPGKDLAASLGYVHKSPHADKKCGNCSFFTKESKELGKCQVMPGKLVKEPGYCNSWAKKV